MNLFQVCAADSRRLHPHEYFALTEMRDWHISEADLARSLEKTG
jgi:hypothetical protein